MKMHRATCYLSNPEPQSACTDPEHLLYEHRTAVALGTVPQRTMPIEERQKRYTGALQQKLDVLENDVLPQTYEEATSKPDIGEKRRPTSDYGNAAHLNGVIDCGRRIAQRA